VYRTCSAQPLRHQAVLHCFKACHLLCRIGCHNMIYVPYTHLQRGCNPHAPHQKLRVHASMLQATQVTSALSRKYRLNHVTCVPLGAGGVKKLSRKSVQGITSGNMSSVFFRSIFVTVTTCLSPSHSSNNKFRQRPPCEFGITGAPPAMPSATGFLPYFGCSTQQCAPTRRSS
jgi:hypothetical protein